jgi:tetratricopeptide (TPR) repeat protein
MTKRVFVMAAAVAALLAVAGCKPKAKEISPLQRREAESLVSEAQFALSVRDLARAEATFARAATLSPDIGDTWVQLGQCRVKLGQRSAAKAAFQSALAIYEADAAGDAVNRVPATLRQIYVLALLGRADDARAVLARARQALPDNAELRGFEESRQIDLMLASPVFKEVAL